MCIVVVKLLPIIRMHRDIKFALKYLTFEVFD